MIPIRVQAPIFSATVRWGVICYAIGAFFGGLSVWVWYR